MSTPAPKKKPDPLSPNTVKNLNDKLYEKRKLGAVEVELLVREVQRAGNNDDKLLEILTFLHETFLSPTASASSRKGGLIALAAAAIGLGTDVDKYLEQLVPPVLNCFLDNDNKVRYYACESLYNITKFIRKGILIFFNRIFDDMTKLVSDPDPNVRGAAELLDNLIKEIVTEGHKFDIDKFIPLIGARIHVNNVECRKYLVSWINTLHHVPNIDLVRYIPSFLDGLFKMLSDPADEMRNTVTAVLFELLKDIRQSPSKVDFSALVPIVIPQCTVTDQYNFTTSLTAMTWINHIVTIGKIAILPEAGYLLGGILPCVSHSSQGVEDIARQANTALLDMVKVEADTANFPSIMATVLQQFSNQRIPTRLASLEWVLALHSRSVTELMNANQELFPVLIKMLSDPSDDVAKYDLTLLSVLSQNEDVFNQLMDSLISLFKSDRKLLDHRGNMIVRQLALNIAPEKILRSLSSILEAETEPEFASTVIQTLNLILLTATEYYEVREKLKNLHKGSQDLFSCLYRSWSHNPTSVLSLCLLCQVYQHASDLITKFSELEITVSFLVEIDKLVQLLESPIFMYLRLQLLEADKYPYLFKSLFGLLMLLPQSSAFETLKNRLAAVTSLGVMQVMPKSTIKVPEPTSIEFSVLLEHFSTLQRKHAETIRSKRLASEKPTASAKKAAAPKGTAAPSNLSLPAQSN